MKKQIITLLTASCLLGGGLVTTTNAQQLSKINLTTEQLASIDKLAQEYINQGMDEKAARMKAEKEIAPEVALRIGNNGYIPTGSTARADLNPWPTNYAAWHASAPYSGSIEIDRDEDIHNYLPSQLVKKILLKSYTPADEARIKNVTFLGFNGIAGGGDAWYGGEGSNPALSSFGTGNRGLAYFTKGTSGFDIEKGLILSTGETWGHEGPNELTNAISGGVKEDGTTYSDQNVGYTTNFDADLNTVSGAPVSLGSILEFDFQPAADQASFDYVFGSEEYPEWVHSAYNDVFGFFVTGPYETAGGAPSVSLPAAYSKNQTTYDGKEVATYNKYNIAKLPNGMGVGVDWTNWGYRPTNTAIDWGTIFASNTNTPWDSTGVGTWLIANSKINLHATGLPIRAKAFNPQYHRVNYDGEAMMELDGITIKLSAVADSLVPGKWYHLKLAIAQVDGQHGDGVFLGNLDLGIPTAAVDTPYMGAWNSTYDAYGIGNWYSNCPQTLTLDFTPDTVRDRKLVLGYYGVASKKTVINANGSPLKDTLDLLKGDSTLELTFKTLEIPLEDNGKEGAITACIVGGGCDTTRAANGGFFKFFSGISTNIKYIPPSPVYPGSLKLNITGGSNYVFRSIDNGLHWEFARDPLTGEEVPFTATQIANFDSEDKVVWLREPNACAEVQFYHFTKDTIGDDIGNMPNRPIEIAKMDGATLNVPAGIHYVVTGSDFSFTITPTGENAGKRPVVTTGRTTPPDNIGVVIVDNGDGSYKVTIRGVRTPIVLGISFTSNPDANMDVDGTNIYSSNGTIYIAAVTAGTANIYHVSGILYKTVTFAAGETSSVSAPAGVYVVTLGNGKSYKIAVQ